MTACAAIKLSAKLAAEVADAAPEDPTSIGPDPDSDNSDGGVPLRTVRGSGLDGSRVLSNGVAEKTSSSEASMRSLMDMTNQAPRSTRTKDSATPQAAHTGRFDALIDLGPSLEREAQKGDPVTNGHSRPETDGTLMPPFKGSQFWSVYGNKLRVFGTKEELCDLNDP